MVQTFGQLKAYFKDAGINLMAEAKAQGIEGTIWNLPFVQVFERADLTVGFRGCEVYPETIRKALADAGLADEITGKFTLISDYNEDVTPTLTLHIELKPQLKLSKNLHNKALKLVLEHLLRENTEFKVLYEASSDKTRPVLKFWDYEHPLHFAKKGKQKWVK